MNSTLLDVAVEGSLLAYLKGNEEAKKYLEGALQFKLMGRAYDYLQGGSTRDQIDVCRMETTLSIAQYIRDHPRATPSQLDAEVQRQVSAFASRLQSLGLV